ncbi:hypothetical protein BDB00DRAFT_824522 [Zychaea mexicana]|uniref:uncharacterized protein n=1 Tax=Zychaea mexicana TaxID=64656 RepID=UPI0022FE1433|nr:uncharacterized protein BDB00DRAFT_824522 [Zychaea mexicana]KAI9493134.1 hypothetical protein BDB00DRAFT_824522 [Zychaea mexicana]
MFRHQISRLTSYTFKYTGMGTTSSSHQDPLPSPQLIEFWVAEAQRGLDALLNDQFDQADSILSQHAAVSPFHAVAYALMAYVEAMLAFDVEKISIASARIAAAEDLARQYGRRVRKRGWNGSSAASFATSTTAAPPCTPPDHDGSHKDNQHEVSIAFDEDGAEKIMISDDSASCTTTSSSSMESVMTAPEEQQQQQQNQKPAAAAAATTTATGTTPSITTKNVRRTFDLQCELLEINCILMSATTQFMGNSWLEYMKATYRLRKSYKMYEHMFTNLTGQKPSECAAMLKRRKHPESSSSSSNRRSPGTATGPLSPNNHKDTRTPAGAEKRFSLFNLPTGVTRTPSSIRSWDSKRRLSLASSNGLANAPCNSSDADVNNNDGEKHDSTVESGVFFGIGLFSLIFSLLPPKVNKILNTLGFHSSRPFALHVLQKSYQSHGLYSSLSALTLLVYFTNLSLFIHPRLLPNSMTRETTRAMLNDMKAKFPNSKIWELLEGKLCKMEGKSRKGVEILRDARRRHSIRVDLGGGTKKWVNEAPREKQHPSSTCSSASPEQRQQQQKKSRMVVSELAQLQGLAVYEMGWAQVFLGDYFQASETFFRLESMNNWSRAFYHYIATCCMFADEQYDKAGMEFQQIPSILDRKRQLGGRLLPNEMFAERKIKRWKEKVHMIISQGTYLPVHLQWMTQPQTEQQQEYMKERYLLLDGELLKQVVVVNPLWELIYLWNGIPQLSTEMLDTMKQQLQSTIDQQHANSSLQQQHQPSDLAILRVILGAVLRELGDFGPAEKCFQATIAMHIQLYEDRWVIPYAMYELAVLNCFRIQQSPDENSDLVPEIRSLIKRAEHYFHAARRNSENNNNNNNNNSSTSNTTAPPSNNNKKDDSSNNNNNKDDTTDNAPPVVDEGDYHDWESRLHIRCQLLTEKLDELQMLITASPPPSIPID